MNLKRSLLLLPVILSSVFFFSCKNGRELKTPSGFSYILHRSGKGPKIKQGDYVTIEMVYRNDKDSILFDSRQRGKQIRFLFDHIPFKGSYEDGLTCLSEGDSATFLVPADSLFRYYFHDRGAAVQQSQTAFTPGSLLKFDVHILRVQDYIDAEQEIAMKESAAEKQEHATLAKYLSDHNITQEPDSGGYYLLFKSKGKGAVPDSGDIVTVRYIASFVDGTVFDNTDSVGRPYLFQMGSHHVVPGWELAFRRLHQGDKAQLILPSRLAYAEKGLMDPRSTRYLVPPFTALVFDLDILSIEKGPLAKK